MSGLDSEWCREGKWMTAMRGWMLLEREPRFTSVSYHGNRSSLRWVGRRGCQKRLCFSLSLDLVSAERLWQTDRRAEKLTCSFAFRATDSDNELSHCLPWPSQNPTDVLNRNIEQYVLLCLLLTTTAVLTLPECVVFIKFTFKNMISKLWILDLIWNGMLHIISNMNCCNLLLSGVLNYVQCCHPGSLNACYDQSLLLCLTAVRVLTCFFSFASKAQMICLMKACGYCSLFNYTLTSLQDSIRGWALVVLDLLVTLQ